MKTLTYKSDTTLKSMFVKDMESHRKADEFLKGTYGRGTGKEWKGCAVGCGVRSLNLKLGKEYDTSDHSAYEIELGIPEWLARLEDTLFEGLPLEDSKKWPVQFAKAIPVGKDVTKVKWQFCAYLLKENIERTLSLDINDNLKKEVVDAIRGVLALHENAIKTGNWSAAWSAESAARSAARSAAWSAWSAARSAAWSAESAAWSAAKEDSYVRHSKQLLKLLKEVQ